MAKGSSFFSLFTRQLGKSCSVLICETHGHFGRSLSASVQTTARYYSRASGENAMASSSFSGSSFKLSADKCSVVVQDNHTFVELHPGTGHSVYTVKQTHADLTIAFRFEALLAPVQIKDGKTLLGDKGSTGYVLHRFIPTGTFEGTVTVKSGAPQPMKGRGLFIHAVQNAKPHQVATTWDCFSVQYQNTSASDDAGALVLLQFRAPAEYGSVTVTQGLVVRKGVVVGVTANATAKHTATRVDETTKYPVPTAIEYRLSGKGAGDAPFSVAVDAQPQNLIGKVDILGELPYLLRKVLQALIAKPFAYFWSEKVSGKLVIGDETVDFSGTAYMETTFINSEQ